MGEEDLCCLPGVCLPKAGLVVRQGVRVGFWEEADAGLRLRDAGITVAGGTVPRKGELGADGRPRARV